MANEFYYNDDFESQILAISDTYAVDMAIEDWLSDLLGLDSSDIIYSSNDYAFRERTRTTDNNLINLPFCNYYRKNVECNTSRLWRNNAKSSLYNMFDKTISKAINKKIRCIPCTIHYEGAIYYSQDKDKEYALKKLLFESYNETILYPSLMIYTGDEIKSVANINLNVNSNENFSENDWLEKNHIHVLTFDLEVETFMFLGDQENTIGICATIGVNFVLAKNKNYLSKDNIILGEDEEHVNTGKFYTVDDVEGILRSYFKIE